MAVADPENRHTHRKNRRIDARRIRLGHASRPAGNDDAADTGEQLCFGVNRKDVALNTRFAHTPREQMAVLSARVENCDTVHGWIIE